MHKPKLVATEWTQETSLLTRGHHLIGQSSGPYRIQGTSYKTSGATFAISLGGPRFRRRVLLRVRRMADSFTDEMVLGAALFAILAKGADFDV